MIRIQNTHQKYQVNLSVNWVKKKDVNHLVAKNISIHTNTELSNSA